VLVLNACRSAHADAQDKPQQEHDNVHDEVRAYGTLAQEVMDAGVAGAVGMRYNVYVVTAAQFIADLYRALASGQTLGQAVTHGRKRLEEEPYRELSWQKRELRDWCVPVVHEASPIHLFPNRPENNVKRMSIDLGDSVKVDERRLINVPQPPDAGFYGRDETLLALDRAFDEHAIVLLHAFAGSGKTAAAAEFARWYLRTGGAELCLFTSFEHKITLSGVLDQLGGKFIRQWTGLTEIEQKKNIVLEILKQQRILWIWDNVEQVAGFPPGTKSNWEASEQEELVEFLRTARVTNARFLLTSRRDEEDWLGKDLPVRIPAPRLFLPDRVKLARGIAGKRKQLIDNPADWIPLLRYTDGNPLTTTVLVGQALTLGKTNRKQISDFIDQIRAGEIDIDDVDSEKRDKSLAASLRYGFEHAFTEEEQKILAILHLFQGVVSTISLAFLGYEKNENQIKELAGLTSEKAEILLQRASDVGLLTNLGGGYFAIHPALPWFFRGLFTKFYPDSETALTDTSTARDARFAYVSAIGGLGSFYFDKIEDGERNWISLLALEEFNLRHARSLALTQGWRDHVTGTMQGLNQLYNLTGRMREWEPLVMEIIPVFVDPENDRSLPDCENSWALVTEYRVKLAIRNKKFREAAQLQKILLNWCRSKAEPMLIIRKEALTEDQRFTLKQYAVSLQDLGLIQDELEEHECADSFREALRINTLLGNIISAANDAHNLGNVYTGNTQLRDLDKAEGYYQQSLNLRPQNDTTGKAICAGSLGRVAMARFFDAHRQKRSKSELLMLLNKALGQYLYTLELLPKNAVDDLAVTHNAIGVIYKNAGQIDQALHYYNGSIRYKEASGNHFGAGRTRYNIALMMAQHGRFEEALLYARAALKNFEPYGEGAVQGIAVTKKLIRQIEELKRKKEQQ